MQSFTRFIVASIMLTAVTVLHAKELPQGEVCVQMEEAGDRLLAGEANDFYFIDVGESQFAIPSFFLVQATMQTVEGQTTVSARPSIMNSRAAKIRNDKNICDWSMFASVGPFEQMYESAGGKEEFKRQEKASYRAGPMNVSLLELDDMKDEKLVVAYDDTGYIVFFTKYPERAYWLINLAAKLDDSE